MAHRASPNGRLGRPSHPASPRVARVARPRRFERQKSTDKGAREGPRRDFRRFRVDFGIDFRCFSRQHCASDVTRSASGRTLDFADRRGTLEGSQTLRKARKSTKIDGKSLRRRFANEPRGKKSIFALPGATWRRFWRLRSIPGRSRALLLASRAALGDPPGDPGACRGRPETLPRRSRDAFRMLLGTTGRPERVAGSILSRFWVLRGSSGQLPGPIWDRFSCQFSHQFRERAGQRMISLSIVRHTSELALGQATTTRLAKKNRSAYRYGID